MTKKVTDADIAVEAALGAEKRLAEMERVMKTPDMPPGLPERWGDKRLTIATPGTLRDDPFYIPEFVEGPNGVQRRVAVHRWINGQFHILNAKGDGKFRWNARGRIGIHKRYGFRFVSYRKLFDGTGLFESGPGDTIWNGDVVLMEIGMEGWERMCRDTAELRGYLEGSYGNEFYHHGDSAGVHTFHEDLEKGTREYMT